MANDKKEINIALLIREVYLKLNSKIQDNLDTGDLTVPQALVIKLVSKEGTIKVSDISSMMNLTNSTVSGILDRLEKQGLITRFRSESDKRVVYVKLTDQGGTVVEHYRNWMNDYFQNILGDITEQELDVILEGLLTLKRVLDRKIE